jgi:hypothetical protein
MLKVSGSDYQEVTSSTDLRIGDPCDYETVLRVASTWGRTELVKKLLQKGVSANTGGEWWRNWKGRRQFPLI